MDDAIRKSVRVLRLMLILIRRVSSRRRILRKANVSFGVQYRKEERVTSQTPKKKAKIERWNH